MISANKVGYASTLRSPKSFKNDHAFWETSKSGKQNWISDKRAVIYNCSYGPPTTHRPLGCRLSFFHWFIEQCWIIYNHWLKATINNVHFT